MLALAAGLFGAPSARADFSFIKEWGALGAGDGQLNAVQRVAVSPGGDVYVTESGNQRVQRFDSNGNFVGKWGNPGPAGSSAAGRFSSPRGIAIGSDLRVYVVDSGNDRVEVFTPEGVFIRTFGSEGPGSGQLSAPEGIATDAAGNVYVADFGNARVQKFTRDGAFVTGWGSSGTGPGQFSFLEDVAVAPDGSVYTVESDNRRVQHFSSTGQALGAFGTQGAGPGAFESPKGIATDASGSVYVADSGNDNVQRFTGSGTPVQTFGTPGSAAGQFQIPLGVATSAAGDVFVTDNGRERVLKFGERDPNADTDGDGLRDVWETDGLDANGDGKVDVDLPAMGASPRHKDVFVELDWMAGHQLSNTALQTVEDAFIAAPVTNPDGAGGIRLHVDNGSASVMNPVTGATWGSRSAANSITHDNVIGRFAGSSYDWSEFDGLKRTNFATARSRVFHYAISGHYYGSTSNTSSGISRGIGASDFLVTLAGFCSGGDCSGTDGQQAGTFMHELGHNLGLRHGGGDHTNRKPNFLSIMNYAFQMSGLSMNGVAGTYDYSRFPPAGTAGFTNTLGALSETSLSETTGFGALGALLPRYTSVVRCPGVWANRSVGGSVDWNCDGDTTDTSVAQDVNNDGARSTLDAYEDWTHIVYDGGGVGDAGAASPLPGRTDRIEPSRTVLLETARVVSRDKKAPRVSIAGRRRVARGRRLTLTVRATDAKGLARVVVSIDRKRSKLIAGRGRKAVTYRIVFRSGRHKVRAGALDTAGNAARSVSVRVRVG